MTTPNERAGKWLDLIEVLANLHGTRSYAMNGQTGVTHQGWSFCPEQLAEFAAALSARDAQVGELVEAAQSLSELASEFYGNGEYFREGRVNAEALGRVDAALAALNQEPTNEQ